MKKLILLIVIFSMNACALKPVLITTTNVGESLRRALPESRSALASELSCQIKDRKAALVEHKKSLQVPIAVWIIAPLAVGGPWYLSTLSASNTTKKEIKQMNENDRIIKEILAESAIVAGEL
jgi:hypothetical protein